jgi:hypothetical protein
MSLISLLDREAGAVRIDAIQQQAKPLVLKVFIHGLPGTVPPSIIIQY